MDLAPLCVPIQVQRADRYTGRWFRLGLELGLDRIRLRTPLPDELCGPPLRCWLHLPPPTRSAAGLGEHFSGELLLHALAGHEVIDQGTEKERSVPCLLLLQKLEAADRACIENYINLRFLSDE